MVRRRHRHVGCICQYDTQDWLDNDFDERPRKKQNSGTTTRAKHKRGAKKFNHIGFEAAMKQFPPGPSDVKELLQPSEDIRMALSTRPTWIHNLQMNFMFGVEQQDTYSGVCCNREAELQIDDVLEPYMSQFKKGLFSKKNL